MNPPMSLELRRGPLRYRISLQCPLCNYQFRSPKILPCYHSFCEACLYAVVSNNSVKCAATGSRFFNCPTCSQRTEIQRGGGVHNLQTNFVLAAHVIKQNTAIGQPWCDVCRVSRKPTDDPVLALLKCWECDKFLCAKCQEVHRSLLKFHTLIRLSQAGPAKVVRHTYCAKHPEEQLRFYCVKCEQAVCRDCRLTTHSKGHSTLDMEDLQGSAKELVTKVNEIIVQTFIPVLEANTLFFVKELEEKQAVKESISAAIAKREQTLLQVVREAASDAQRQLEEVMEAMQAETRKYRDNLTRIRSETEFNEMVLESGCEGDMIQAAINVMPYASNKSPQARLISLLSLKQELRFEAKDVAEPLQPPPMPDRGDPDAKRAAKAWTYNLMEWKHFAVKYLGRVTLDKQKLTMSVAQCTEENYLVKCFRRIGMLVDAFRKSYNKFAVKPE